MDKMRALVNQFARPYEAEVVINKSMYTRFLTITLIGPNKSVTKSVDMKEFGITGPDTTSFLMGMIHAMKGELLSGD